MISLTVFFVINILLFTVIGGMRGWAKELLVSFGVVLALFIITVFTRYVPIIGPILTSNSIIQYWFSVFVLAAMLAAAYQTPNIAALQKGKFQRGKIPDTLLGLFIGMINGFLIAGSFWYFLDQANYPYGLITPPIPGTEAGDQALRIIPYLPPQWLVPPLIFIVLALFSVVLLIMFI